MQTSFDDPARIVADPWPREAAYSNLVLLADWYLREENGLGRPNRRQDRCVAS